MSARLRRIELAVSWCVAFALWGCDGCGGCGDSDSAASEKPQPLARVEPDAASAAPPAQPENKPEYPKPGWSKVTFDNEVPLCVFAGHAEREEALFLKDVKPQKLKAKSSVVFGAFGPWCVNEQCDDLPSLQCSAELAGDTITVQTRYWGYHRDGAACTETCRRVTAGCKTAELAAGTYKIVYGDKRFELRIPSRLPSPCFVDQPLDPLNLER